MVNDCDGPEQSGVPFEKFGVTVIVLEIAFAVLLVALNALIVPVPEAAKPIAVLEFVQLYEVIPPELLVEKATVSVVEPLHRI